MKETLHGRMKLPALCHQKRHKSSKKFFFHVLIRTFVDLMFCRDSRSFITKEKSETSKPKVNMEMVKAELEKADSSF